MPPSAESVSAQAAAVPAEPAACRRANRLRFLLSLLPALVCLGLLLAGAWPWALAVFTLTFLGIAYGATLPRARLFAAHVDRLPESQARTGGVWITVDDGPDPATTPALLEVLDRHQAKAGFFLIGDKARRHPELVRAIAARGHLVGNHSQTHPAGSFWRLRPARMWREIAGCQQTLTGILGAAPVWFRPPVGHHNLFIGPPLRALGLTMAIWNCRGYDGIERNPQVILRRLRRTLAPGAVVLLHDGTAACVEVLEGTLRLLEERGLKPVLPEVR